MANIVVEDRAGEDAPGGHLFVRNGEAEVVADGGEVELERVDEKRVDEQRVD